MLLAHGHLDHLHQDAPFAKMPPAQQQPTSKARAPSVSRKREVRHSQPLRCVAASCGVDLSTAKRYCQRHRTCDVHLKVGQAHWTCTMASFMHARSTRAPSGLGRGGFGVPTTDILVFERSVA